MKIRGPLHSFPLQIYCVGQDICSIKEVTGDGALSQGKKQMAKLKFYELVVHKNDPAHGLFGLGF